LQEPAANARRERKRKRGAGTSHIIVEADQGTTKKRPFGGILRKMKRWFEDIVKRKEVEKGKRRENIVKRSGDYVRNGGYRGQRQGGKR